MIARERKLQRVYVALTNAISVPEILEIVTQFGYTLQRLQEGLQHYSVAYELETTLANTQAELKKVKEQRQASWQRLRAFYLSDRPVAQVAFKENGETQYSAHVRQLSRRIDKGYEQVKSFYQVLKANPNLQAMVENRGITHPRIDMVLQQAQEVEAGRVAMHLLEETIDSLRQQGNEAMRLLDRWMSTFRRVARAALASTPHHLVTLGLDPASNPNKRTSRKPALPPVQPAVLPPIEDELPERVAPQGESAASEYGSAHRL